MFSLAVEYDDSSEDDSSSGDDSGDEDESDDDRYYYTEYGSDTEEVGEAPTPKRKKLAQTQGLELALKSGRYPEFLGIEGLYSYMDPKDNNYLDFFKLLWPPSLVDVIVVETNRYALSRGRRGWVNVSRDEMWTFLGIILVIGFHKVPRLENYWSRDSLLGIPEIQRHMSLARFWGIWTNLHVVDNTTLPPDSGLADKIRPVLDVLEDTFFMNYSPGRELSVDEAMIKYKGRVSKGKVKMPKKPIKCGFKVWCCACANTGYLCTFQVYGGQPTNPKTGEKMKEKGLTMRVVQDLVRPFSDCNHVVYLDNYYTSGPLVDALLEMKVYTVGTIQQRARGFPSCLKGLKPPEGRYAAKSVGDTCYFTFKDRTLVNLVTNAFPECMEGRVARLQPKAKGKAKGKSKALYYQHVPPVLPAYNKYMGGVDRVSQLRRNYGYDRKSRRYWLRGFMQFFDYAVNNSYIIYKLNCRHFKTRPSDSDKFRKDLAHLLLKNTRYRSRSNATLGRDEEVCQLVRVSDIGLARGRCVNCLKMKRRPKHTSFGCSHCRVRLCKTVCFHEYHR